MRQIDWKAKLTSRKFIAAVGNFVSMLLIALKVDESIVTQVVALIMAGGGLIAYIVAEGWVDANNIIPDSANGTLGTVEQETEGT